MESQKFYKGEVVNDPYVSVVFDYQGQTRRILIDKPKDYKAKQALVGKQVTFKLIPETHPNFISELGYAVII